MNMVLGCILGMRFGDGRSIDAYVMAIEGEEGLERKGSPFFLLGEPLGWNSYLFDVS